MGLRISIFVKNILFCMGLPHTNVGFERLIHVSPIAILCNRHTRGNMEKDPLRFKERWPVNLKF